MALKVKTQPQLFFAHVRRNRHFKKNIIDLKVNEGEKIFIPSAQADLLKDGQQHTVFVSTCVILSNFYSFSQLVLPTHPLLL